MKSLNTKRIVFATGFTALWITYTVYRWIHLREMPYLFGNFSFIGLVIISWGFHKKDLNKDTKIILPILIVVMGAIVIISIMDFFGIIPRELYHWLIIPDVLAFGILLWLLEKKRKENKE